MGRRLSPLCLLPIFFAAGCFPHQPGPRLAHFETTAPVVGEPAPDFALRDLDGRTVELAELIGDRPIVLRFGSHSCPVYRYRRFSMSNLWEEFRGRVHFLLIYTLEAHPVGSKSPYADGEWDPWWNRLTGVRVQQTEDEESRRRQAAFSHQRLDLEPPMVVDDLDNAVWQAYGAASSPAFV
ncbi:MAG: deiodinase-like protein, partial [Thermoanaerobaculia bacterium]